MLPTRLRPHHRPLRRRPTRRRTEETPTMALHQPTAPSPSPLRVATMLVLVPPLRLHPLLDGRARSRYRVRPPTIRQAGPKMTLLLPPLLRHQHHHLLLYLRLSVPSNQLQTNTDGPFPSPMRRPLRASRRISFRAASSRSPAAKCHGPAGRGVLTHDAVRFVIFHKFHHIWRRYALCPRTCGMQA